MKNLVSVEWFRYPQEAHLLRSRLEADGIECFLAGDQYGNVIMPFEHDGGGGWNNAVGGVFVMVKSGDSAAAAAIMQELKRQPRQRVQEPSQGSVVWLILASFIAGAVVLFKLIQELGIYALWTAGLAVLLIALTIGVKRILP